MEDSRPSSVKGKAPPQLTPPDYEVADAFALQSLQRGDASPEMQRRALAWIINRAAGTYEVSFSPENQHLTSFGEGRRFVGLQVVKLLSLNTSKLKKAD